MNDPEIERLRQEAIDDLQRRIAEHDPVDTEYIDPVVEDIVSGASRRALAAARDDLARARAEYHNAVLSARTAGFSWAEIDAVLGVSRQQLHRHFRAFRAGRPATEI